MSNLLQQKIKEWEDIEENTVNFYTDFLGQRNTQMKACNFHLPFTYMRIILSKSYNNKINSLRIIKRKEDKTYSLVSPEENNAISFSILESGEIVIDTIDNSLVDNIEDITEEIAKKLLVTNNKDKFIYNLVYDTIATIDFINNSKYVVTKHSTNKRTGEKKKGSFIEKRIKIKNIVTKYTYDNETIRNNWSKHRYKYRVRGHWRIRENKKEWVKEHVRGGDGTIFIPKEYEIID